jgi:hypothetical protein
MAYLTSVLLLLLYSNQLLLCVVGFSSENKTIKWENILSAQIYLATLASSMPTLLYFSVVDLDPDSMGSLDPDSQSGSGSRREKMIHKNRKTE